MSESVESRYIMILGNFSNYRFVQSVTEALLVTLRCAQLQKRKVLADPSLPPEFRISLAKSLRHDLFSKVLDILDSFGDHSINVRKITDMSLQIPFLVGIQERVRATFTAEVRYGLLMDKSSCMNSS